MKNIKLVFFTDFSVLISKIKKKYYLDVFFKKSLLKSILYHNINLSVFVFIVASAFEENH